MAPRDGESGTDPGKAPLAPHPSRLGLLGNLLCYARNPLPSWERWRTEHGDSVRLDLGAQRFHLAFHPEAVEAVLKTRQARYPRQGHPIEVLKLVQGLGLATVDGEVWRRRRRLLQPLFVGRAVERYFPLMGSAIEGFLAGWGELPPEGAVLDLDREMVRLSLRIGAVTMLGAELSDRWMRDLEAAMETILAETMARVANPLSLPVWLPLPRHRRFRQALALLDGLVGEAISGAGARGAEAADLVARLVAVRDEETGKGLTPRELRDEIVTVAGAAHDTTGLGLAWTLGLLAHHPEALGRLEAELASVLADRFPEPADLDRLPWLSAVLHEALRLRPPVYGLVRQAAEDDVLAGYRVRAGTYVVVSQWVTHRHPGFWDRPEVFAPERFLGGVPESLPAGAYFPFGIGGHVCIGQAFAWLDTRLLLAALLSRFTVEPVEPTLPEPRPGLTLRPSRPIRLRVRRRE